MTGNFVHLAAQHRGRPLLMRPSAAEELALRIRAIDADAFVRPSRIGALLRRLGGGRGRAADANAVRTPTAWDDDGWTPPTLSQQLAYSPVWLPEPEAYGYCWTLNQGVALMKADTPLLAHGEEYCGTVYHGYDTLLAGMNEAAEDGRVQAIFLNLQTPGGVVDPGLPELANFMRENREAAGGKPIWVYASMACSAGYWIAAQADRVITGRVGLVGSIGAVIVHENHAGALEKAGVELTPIEFPSGKTAGAWWSALPDDAKADLQAEIEQCARDFCTDLEAGRPKLTTEALLGLNARVFMGHNDDPSRSAKELGLVDDLMGETAAFQALLDHLSASQTAGFTPAATPGRGATAPTPTEEPMALRPQPNAGRGKALTPAKKALADAQAAAERASAELERAKAAAEADPDDVDDETGDEVEDETTGGDDTSKQPDAAAIAASEEAKSHPKLALAAIQSGMTLAQFQASVSAAGVPAASTPARGGLHAFMTDNGSKTPRRVGPDAAAASKPQRSAKDDHRRNLEAGLKARQR